LQYIYQAIRPLEVKKQAITY